MSGSGSGRSERHASKLLDHQKTAQAKFPKWNADARQYYNELREKDRNGNIKLHSLDHYLYHTHLHQMLQERVTEVHLTAQSKKNVKESAAAANATVTNTTAAEEREGGKGSDSDASEDPCTRTLEPAPKNSVSARAARDNADGTAATAPAASAPEKRKRIGGDTTAQASKRSRK